MNAIPKGNEMSNTLKRNLRGLVECFASATATSSPIRLHLRCLRCVIGSYLVFLARNMVQVSAASH